MATPGERLIEIRQARGYASVTDAAMALGMARPTYYQHEAGIRPISRKAAERYARFFRTTLDWLMLGTGERDRRSSASEIIIPVLGLVGAGSGAGEIGDTSGYDPPDEITLPGEGFLAALVVIGTSMEPRFHEGERILYDTRPIVPNKLIGKYAVVQALDGRRMVKILRKGGSENRWNLESYNSPVEKDVKLLGIWQYLGVVAAR